MAANSEGKAKLDEAKLTGFDIFKSVSVALLIAFLIYWLPILAERFIFSAVEINYRFTTLYEGSGYLISIKNYSSKPVDEISIYANSPDSLGSVVQDGAISVEKTATHGSNLLRLKNLAPNKEAILFAQIKTPLGKDQIRFASSSTITSVQDSTNVERKFWEPSSFFSSVFTALMYLAMTLVMTSHQKQRRVANEMLELKIEQLRKTHDERVRLLDSRIMRARAYMQRRIIILNEEVGAWRKFFRAIYSTMFEGKNESEQAIEIILKASGIRMAKRLHEYGETEFLDVLESHARDAEETSTTQKSGAKSEESPKQA